MNIYKSLLPHQLLTFFSFSDFEKYRPLPFSVCALENTNLCQLTLQMHHCYIIYLHLFSLPSFRKLSSGVIFLVENVENFLGAALMRANVFLVTVQGSSAKYRLLAILRVVLNNQPSGSFAHPFPKAMSHPLKEAELGQQQIPSTITVPSTRTSVSKNVLSPPPSRPHFFELTFELQVRGSKFRDFS